MSTATPASNTPANFFPNGFTAVRPGIKSHIKDGRFSPFDLGIFLFLLINADWSTGIYMGCALTIAYGFGDHALKGKVQKTLRRLRDSKYINYPAGNGDRGEYPILLNKYTVTKGELSGKRLNAWKHDGLCTPEYEAWNCLERLENGSRTETERLENGKSNSQVTEDTHTYPQFQKSPGTVTELKRNGDGTETEPYLDVLDVSRFALDIGGGGGGETPDGPPLSDSKSTPSDNERQSLLSDMRAIWDFHKLSGWNTKPKDEQDSADLSDQYGKRMFLQAFDTWCCHDASDQIETKNYETLKFPLPKFFGQVDYYIKQSQDGIEVKRRHRGTNACPIVREVEVVA